MDNQERDKYELRIERLKKYLAAYNIAIDEIFGVEKANQVRSLAKEKCDWMTK